MYPLSIRKKILAIKEKEQLTYAVVGKRFAIHPRTIQRWQQRLEPKTTRDKPATKIDMEALRRDVEQYPDHYQWERAERFHVHPWSIGVALRRLGITYKKNPAAPAGRRSGTYLLPDQSTAL
jgi:Transposase.